MIETVVGAIVFGVIAWLSIDVAEKEADLRDRRSKKAKQENERIAEQWRNTKSNERWLTIDRTFDSPLSPLIPPQRIKQSFGRDKDACRRIR